MIPVKRSMRPKYRATPEQLDVTPQQGEWSYRRVLQEKRLTLLLFGIVILNIGDGMMIVTLPIQALQVRAGFDPALVVAAVEIAPFLLAAALALRVGLGSLWLPSKPLLYADCTLRFLMFATLGILSSIGRLGLPVLIVGLMLGSVLRLLSLGEYRTVATGMVPGQGRFAVNALLGIGSNVAAYVVGPALGGVIASTASPGWVLLMYSGIFLVLFVVVFFSVGKKRRSAAPMPDTKSSGLQILRQTPISFRLLMVVILFNLLYMPVVVALPLHVGDRLGGGAGSLGAIWSGFGAGALVGAIATNRLRRIPERTLLISIIAAWGISLTPLAFATNTNVAVLSFALGGLIYAPFTPVAYSYVQSRLSADEQQPVIALWTAGVTLASPIGLLIGGPLVSAVGPQRGLLISSVSTIALSVLAFFGLRDKVRQ